jgi:hypothetical protein
LAKLFIASAVSNRSHGWTLAFDYARAELYPEAGHAATAE